MTIPKKYLSGTKFGKLTIIKELKGIVYPYGRKHRSFLVKCTCGGDPFEIPLSSLKRHPPRACSCYKKDPLYRFHESYTYVSWHAMLGRCKYATTIGWKNYGGRGIKVCSRWNPEKGGSFKNFLKDMGERPEGLELDRIDVNGNYNKENCRWVSTSVQIRNRRIHKNNNSGISGVLFYRNAWEVQISSNKKGIYLGRFKSKEEAIRVRRDAELKYYGETKIPETLLSRQRSIFDVV